jgi:hypothetical protein
MIGHDNIVPRRVTVCHHMITRMVMEATSDYWKPVDL